MSLRPVVVLLERCLMLPSKAGWSKVSISSPAEAVEPIAKAFAGKTIRLLYEPDSLATEAVDCPPAKRSVGGAVFLKKFPGIAQETTGWGFLEPLPQGGKYATLLSVETGSGMLFDLVTSLRTERVIVEAAFPLGAVLSKSGSRGVGVVLIDEESGAVGVLRRPMGARISRRANRAVGAPIEEIWTGLEHCFGEAALTTNSVVSVYTTGVEIPENLRSAFGLTVTEWDKLAAEIRAIPLSNPANLIGSFPIVFGLRRVYGAVTLFALIVGLLLGFNGWNASASAEQEIADQREKKEAAEKRLSETEAKHNEIAALTRLYEGEVSEPRGGRAEFLKAVVEALPRNCTLTTLRMFEDGRFHIEGIFLFATEADTKERLVGPILTSISRAGFPTGLNRATYTSSAARFAVDGEWQTWRSETATDDGEAHVTDTAKAQQ